MSKKTFHKIIQHTGYTLTALLIALLLAAGGGALWLWGWTWKDAPRYHESWTPQEQAAITEFDRYLRQQYAIDNFNAMVNWHALFRESGIPNSSLGWCEKLYAAYIARHIAAPISAMLHEAAESGSAAQTGTVSFLDIYGLTPAIVAAQTAHLKALEALVQHCANPNAIAYNQMDEYTEPMEADTPISPLLNGNFTHGHKLSWDTRRQTAEFLLAHGGNLHTSQSINQLSCEMALMLRTPEGIAPWEWALNNGLPMTSKGLCIIVRYAEGRSLLERVLREKLVDVNDVSGSWTVLQSLLWPLSRPYDEVQWNAEGSVKVMEEYLDMLLAAGAVPNLIPREAEPQRPGESDEEYEERLYNSDALQDTPLDIATKALESAELPAHRELCRRLIEKLKQAGAKTSAELRAEISH